MMRSWLFVPASKPAMIEKALASPADAVIIDLEDSIAPPSKPHARKLTASIVKDCGNDRHRLFVRINPPGTDFYNDDLEAILPASPGGLMLPKSNSGRDVAALGKLAGPDMPIIAIATETAASLFNLGSYDSLEANLLALAWGAEDLSNELGAAGSRTKNGLLTAPYQLARSLCLAGARSAGVEPVDTVFLDFRDDDGLAHECRAAAFDGFTGKLAIHPAQTAIINEIFTPSKADIARARAIVDAFAAEPDAGVIAIDGRMYDIPHLKRARKLLARAGKISSNIK